MVAWSTSQARAVAEAENVCPLVADSVPSPSAMSPTFPIWRAHGHARARPRCSEACSFHLWPRTVFLLTTPRA